MSRLLLTEPVDRNSGEDDMTKHIIITEGYKTDLTIAPGGTVSGRLLLESLSEIDQAIAHLKMARAWMLQTGTQQA